MKCSFVLWRVDIKKSLNVFFNCYFFVINIDKVMEKMFNLSEILI